MRSEQTVFQIMPLFATLIFKFKNTATTSFFLNPPQQSLRGRAEEALPVFYLYQQLINTRSWNNSLLFL